MFLQFIIVLTVFAGLDLFWTGFLMKSFYFEALGGLLKPQISFPALIGIYISLAFLVTFYIIPMFRALGLGWQTILIAFAFGVALYAFYECTNFALIKDWPAKIIFLDIVWGGVIVALGSTLSLFIKDILSK